MDAVDTLHFIARFLAILSIIQGLEFLSLASVTSDLGVWRWPDLEDELGGENQRLRKIFRFFLSANGFDYLNIVRILTAIHLFFLPQAFSVIVLFAIHLLTLLRWLGSFNGGSDYMTLLLLAFTSLGLLFPNQIATVCVWYISFQVCLSYFKAGWIKLKNPLWRKGIALGEFIHSPIYQPKRWLQYLTRSRKMSQLSSWSVIIFELTFPLCLLQTRVAISYMVIGFLFHLLNAYVFGLNRFVLAWLAAYPAILYCSQAVRLT